MKIFLFASMVFCCVYLNTYSQEDGRIISKTNFVLPQNVVDELKSSYNEKIVSEILALNYYRITYMSDSLKVTGYLVAPKENQKYPCIIFNRGGNKEFGQWNPKSIAVWLDTTAIWGYVVIASQYRGNDGGEGTEDFGGRDVNDVLNLIPVLEQQPNADTSRIGIEGWSRGGMMTYIALTKTCKFKAAVVGAGLANAFTQISRRPEMEERVFSKLIPNYNNRKQEELTKRSAVFWADKMCKTTPLLIMHGASDWRVTAAESLQLINKLYESNHPVRFMLYEGADHAITEFTEQTHAERKRHFDYYLRDENPLPTMKLHGK